VRVGPARAFLELEQRVPWGQPYWRSRCAACRSLVSALSRLFGVAWRRSSEASIPHVVHMGLDDSADRSIFGLEYSRTFPTDVGAWAMSASVVFSTPCLVERSLAALTAASSFPASRPSRHAVVVV